jgi:hypothetical protein
MIAPAIVCGVISVTLTLYAGRHAPIALLAMFVVWVAAPFVGLAALAGRVPGSTAVPRAFAWIAIVLPIGVFAAHIDRHPESGGAFPFLVTPVLSWVLLAMAALSEARRSGR